MTKRTLGFIGFGNMGGAMARRVWSSPDLSAAFAVAVHDLNESSRQTVEESGGQWFADAPALAEASDLVILAVKPYHVAEVIAAIRPVLTPAKTLLSIAAGQPLSALRAALDGACPAVQAMPNTPALVGDGVFGVCFDDPDLSGDVKDSVRLLFGCMGLVLELPESRMNALMAVTGCGPAFVFQMMDAMMEAAVTLGFTRKEATDMVAALFRGTARMVAETGQHPQVLHSQVTSPKGTTIAGTNHLARTAVRGHIIDAVLASAARGRELENE